MADDGGPGQHHQDQRNFVILDDGKRGDFNSKRQQARDEQAVIPEISCGLRDHQTAQDTRHTTERQEGAEIRGTAIQRLANERRQHRRQRSISKGNETDRIWGLRQGAREYLVKPGKPEELLARVADLAH